MQRLPWSAVAFRHPDGHRSLEGPPCLSDKAGACRQHSERERSWWVLLWHHGIGNRLTLLDDEIIGNLKDIQLRNGLPPSVGLSSGDFTVEMETGTGKTYVYLRSVFELNKRYGFTKFVIVVPSVAIKEGVYKTLQITEAHFTSLYSGQPYDYFLYDSAKLGQVRNFATSPTIQIMVVTVGAINKKDVNNLYKDSEKTGGERPIDLIRAMHPVIIVDEPQSVDGGLEGRGNSPVANEWIGEVGQSQPSHGHIAANRIQFHRKASTPRWAATTHSRPP